MFSLPAFPPSPSRASPVVDFKIKLIIPVMASEPTSTPFWTRTVPNSEAPLIVASSKPSSSFFFGSSTLLSLPPDWLLDLFTCFDAFLICVVASPIPSTIAVNSTVRFFTILFILSEPVSSNGVM